MNGERNEKASYLVLDLYAKGIFWLERQDYEIALKALLECHRLEYRKKEIEEIILEKCWQSHQNQFRQTYLKNVNSLRSYPYIYRQNYPDFTELHYQFIPYSDLRFIIFDRETGAFTSDIDLEQRIDLSTCQENDTVLINNEFRLSNILACEEKTRGSKGFLWKETPMYLYYRDFNEFVQYLQVLDFSPALESERLVFLFGREEVEQYFSEQAVWPNRLWNIRDKDSDDIVCWFPEIMARTDEKIRDLEERLKSYYAGFSKQDLFARLQGGKPRILFHTSRFTTALQYYLRDCALACDKLGIPNQILIEKSNLHRITLCDLLTVLNDFKPDVVFYIDHFRWESLFSPENIIYITWVQDVLPNIASRESAAKLGPLDFILNAFVTNKNFLLDFGYPSEAIIEAPFAANPQTYKTYSLNKQEKERYRADVCAFSNTGNPQKGLSEFLAYLKQNTDAPSFAQLETIFKSAYREMYERFYQEEIFYSLEDYQRFLSGYLEVYGLLMHEESLDKIAQVWRAEVGFRLFRSIPLEWLHEKGYVMKIWGSEWSDHPVLAAYAQGVVSNGKTLSRMLNACKIVIGTNPGLTTHPRVFESILSNSFYLAYRIPEEHDWANIRKYLQEGQEIVFAYSREDLYRKVDYYLEHIEERKKIIRRAKKTIKKSLTYEALMSRVIKEIAQRLDCTGNGG